MEERNESILTSIKKLLGINDDYTEYDADVIMHINAVFSILNDLGVGPSDGFMISDESTKWSDYITNWKMFSDVKTYIYLKVRMIFDPPQSGSVSSSYQESIKELEWRICNRQEFGGAV